MNARIGHELITHALAAAPVSRRVAHDACATILQDTANALRRLSDALGGDGKLLLAASKVEAVREDIDG